MIYNYYIKLKHIYANDRLDTSTKITIFKDLAEILLEYFLAIKRNISVNIFKFSVDNNSLLCYNSFVVKKKLHFSPYGK